MANQQQSNPQSENQKHQQQQQQQDNQRQQNQGNQRQQQQKTLNSKNNPKTCLGFTISLKFTWGFYLSILSAYVKSKILISAGYISTH
ncbi:hypothetical protein [Acinetobacter sp. CS-2]|uniref:hypothetical protein n=1 Tax=Acinetobacter sp. CS-2 TaxID=2798861 RepID=UPI0019054DC4|nr:hypothetical protein [Acinetobacter sp. CS-2]QQN38107.1 hypothetical protein JFY49_08565 [Acinetobacter sp. CS-2]